MAGTETKRIIELTEASTVQSGDFIAVDSNARGTKKVPTSALATSAALTAETNARAGADEQMSERMDGIEEQTALIQNPTKTLSGALCSFADGADMPMVACTVSIEPKQSGTGTPSPDNVRPISGWESVSVDVAGKNAFSGTTKNNKSLNGSGNEETDYSRSCTTAIKIEAGEAYTISYTEAVDCGVFYYDKNNTFLSLQGWASKPRTFTPPANTAFVRFAFKQGTAPTNIQIELGTTATTYEPYNAHTTTTSLGRTVYGGTLDVVSGVLTVDKGYMNYNGSENWAADSNGNRYTIGVAGSYREGYTRIQVISNEGAFSSGSSVGTIFLSNSQLYYYPPTSVTSLADFKTWLASNNLQVVYPLATPQTYQLTPTEVQTLLGENNVWADSGDVEITYRRDISIVLESLENALSGSNSLNAMMMSAPTENTAEEPTEDEAEDDMR